MVGLMPDVRGGTPDTTHYRADTSFGSAATGSPGALHGNTACVGSSNILGNLSLPYPLS